MGSFAKGEKSQEKLHFNVYSEMKPKVKSTTFGLITGVSQSEVQWKGLALGEPHRASSVPGKYALQLCLHWSYTFRQLVHLWCLRQRHRKVLDSRFMPPRGVIGNHLVRSFRNKKSTPIQSNTSAHTCVFKCGHYPGSWT